MNTEPKEGEWPTVEDPRACLRAVEKALDAQVLEQVLGRAEPPAPLNYTSAKLLARVAHERAVLEALKTARAMVANVQEQAQCTTQGVPSCFPSCMSEPHRTHWVNTDAALRAEAEAREKRKVAESA